MLRWVTVKVVCPACKNVCEAGAPAPAPPAACEGCGAALAQIPAGDAGDLVVREDTLEDGTHVLRLPRPRGPALRTLLFALAWNGGVGSALLVAWLNDGGPVFVVLAVFAAVGLAFLYLGARGLVNHVRFEVGPRGVRVEERPLPAGRPTSYAPEALLGFTAQHATWDTSAVYVLLRDGPSVELPFGFATVAQASWVAGRLQQWLDELPPAKPYR